MDELSSSGLFDFNDSNYEDYVLFDHDECNGESVPDLSTDDEEVSTSNLPMKNLALSVMTNVIQDDWENELDIIEEPEYIAAIKKQSEKRKALWKKLALARKKSENRDLLISTSESVKETGRAEERQSSTLDDSLAKAKDLLDSCSTSYDSLDNTKTTSATPMPDSSLADNTACKRLKSTQSTETGKIKMAAEETHSTNAEIASTDSGSKLLECASSPKLIDDKPCADLISWGRYNIHRKYGKCEPRKRTPMECDMKKQSDEDKLEYERTQIDQTSVNDTNQPICIENNKCESQDKKELLLRANRVLRLLKEPQDLQKLKLQQSLCAENHESALRDENIRLRMENSILQSRLRDLDVEKTALQEGQECLNKEKASLAKETQDLLKLKLDIDREKQKISFAKSTEDIESLKDICRQLTQMLENVQLECAAWRSEKESLRELVDYQKHVHDAEKSILEKRLSFLQENCDTLTGKVENLSAEKVALLTEKDNRLQEQEVVQAVHESLTTEIASLKNMNSVAQANFDSCNMQLTELSKRNAELLKSNAAYEEVVNSCCKIYQPPLENNHQYSEFAVNFYKAKVEKYEKNIFQMMSSEKYYLKQIESMTYEINTLRNWNKILASRSQNQQTVGNTPYWN